MCRVSCLVLISVQSDLENTRYWFLLFFLEYYELCAGDSRSGQIFTNCSRRIRGRAYRSALNSQWELVVAGTDTTSTTLEWAIAELIRNAHVKKKAQQEIDKVVGHERLVEEKDMADLPYLRAIVKETLRLHPAVPLLVPHRAERDCMIGDFLVPKDAQVIVNCWAIARDPGVWEEPLKFRPERFLHTNLDFKGQNYELIPFGSGRRMCVGLPLANIMIHSFLAALIQGFDWACIDNDDEVDMDYGVAVTMHKARPLVVKATPRLDSTFYQSLTVTDPN